MQVYSMDYLTDRLVLLAVENSKLLRDSIYLTLQAASAEFPKLLTLCSVFYWSVLYEKSRNQIDKFFENKLPGILYRKFKILTVVMSSETMTLDDFLSGLENLKQLNERLAMISVKVDLNADGLKTRLTDQVNAHVDDIIKLLENSMETIEGYLKIDDYLKKAQQLLTPEELSKIRQLAQAEVVNSTGEAFKRATQLNPFKGGTKRKRRKTRRKRTRGGIPTMLELALMPKNKGMYELWKRKDPVKYANYDKNLYYPNLLNPLKTNPFGLPSSAIVTEPITWSDRVKVHCGKKINGSSDMKPCVKEFCNPLEDYNMKNSSCDHNREDYGQHLWGPRSK